MASGSQQDEIQKGTVTGGMDNTSKQHHGPAGGAVIHKRSGKPRAIYQNGDAYYEDPDQPGRFRKNTRRHDYIDVEAYAPPQAQSAAAAPVGAPPPSNKPPKDWRDNIDKTIHPGSVGSSPGLETSGIVDTTGMDNFMGSMAATPGAVVNPNVDPNNWMYQVNPEHQIARNVGVYKNPAIDDWLKNSQKGLLSASGGMV